MRSERVVANSHILRIAGMKLGGNLAGHHYLNHRRVLVIGASRTVLESLTGGKRMKIIMSRIWSIAAILLASAGMVSAAPVTFQVNMEVQATLGAFDPAAHTVELRGVFDGWGAGVTLAQSAGNTNVYEGTVDIPGSSGQVEYKFVLNQAGTLVWEGNVGAGGAANRSVTLTGSAQTLPVVYFNNQSAPPGVVAVTFQVNMGVQASIGNFDRTAHTVEARGAFDNWGPGITLSPSETDTNIFVGTANVTGSAGMVLEHKFVINQAGTLVYEGNVGPGGPFGNRVFTLASPPDQLLPVVYFNNLTNVVAAIPVTFRVNMGVQIARGAFDPGLNNVTLAGPFNNWSATATQLTNSLAQPYIFEATVDITGVSPGGTVPFKFLNNNTWEAGNDRTFVLASSAQTLPIEYFDRIPDLGRLTVTRNPTPFDVEVRLEWTGAVRIRVQTATSLVTGVWEDVPNTLGASTATLMYDETPGPRFFRLIGP